MRVLHIVKTSNGATWAALQVSELVRLGVKVDVVLPEREGRTMAIWRASGASLHFGQLNFPTGAPWRLAAVKRNVRAFIGELKPDLIHTHHVGTTLTIRAALRDRADILRVFEVPGPLHLEHPVFRRWELSSAQPNDRWIGTSRCILNHYRRAGIVEDRLLLSYAGLDVRTFRQERTGALREQLGIEKHQMVVGNINLIYAPKYYLGQRVGLKCHEDVIQALAIVLRERKDVVGVLAGGPWGNAQWYEKKLRARASRAGAGRILMPGLLPPELVRIAWADYDCAVHVPLSENCGGVVEPLLCGVPVIAGNVGGLPEIVEEGLTGKLVPIRKPDILAKAILEVLANLDHYRGLAQKGRERTLALFDVRHTSAEVLKFYKKVLVGATHAAIR
jgi:glycosyltransferase involved in cell wall biosynthesis